MITRVLALVLLLLGAGSVDAATLTCSCSSFGSCSASCSSLGCSLSSSSCSFSSINGATSCFGSVTCVNCPSFASCPGGGGSSSGGGGGTGTTGAGGGCTSTSGSGGEKKEPITSPLALFFIFLAFLGAAAVFLVLVHFSCASASRAKPTLAVELRLTAVESAVQKVTDFLDESDSPTRGQVEFGLQRYAVSQHELWGVCCCNCCRCELRPNDTVQSRQVRFAHGCLIALAATILVCGVDPNVNFAQSTCSSPTTTSQTSTSTAGTPTAVQVWYTPILVFLLKTIGSVPGNAVAHGARYSALGSGLSMALITIGAAFFVLAIVVRSRIDGTADVATYVGVYFASVAVDWLFLSWVKATAMYAIGWAVLSSKATQPLTKSASTLPMTQPSAQWPAAPSAILLTVHGASGPTRTELEGEAQLARA